jgi:hypothetical protein
MKLHALTFDAIRRVGRAGLKSVAKALGRDQKGLERQEAELQWRAWALARISLLPRWGDHAKDQKAKVRALQVRSQKFHHLEGIMLHV